MSEALMAEREHSFDHEGGSRAVAADADNGAVDAQPRAGTQLEVRLPGRTGALAPGGELERAEAAGARAEALLALVRGTLRPAYRRAVDALDPLAALEASQRRAEEIRAFVQARGILQQAEAVAILERLPAQPTASQLMTAVRDLRPLIVGELQAEANAMRYPGAKVLRDVKLLEEQPQISLEAYKVLRDVDKQGLRTRPGPDGERVYRTVTDIDALVIEVPFDGAKAKILRLEQQKSGATDKHSKADAQNQAAVQAIKSSREHGHSVRLEPRQNVDIAEQLDLSTVDSASQVTVGPAGKSFDESLDITAADLERLVKDMIKEVMSSRGRP